MLNNGACGSELPAMPLVSIQISLGARVLRS